MDAVVTRMLEKRMRSTVAVTVGNRHIGQVNGHGASRQVNCLLAPLDMPRRKM